MEVAGAVLGVVSAVGVIGQLLDGCIKGLKIYKAAANVGRDSERLMCRVRIEEIRLLIWGREWGVTTGQFEAAFASATTLEGGSPTGSVSLRSLAELILTQLHSTITDLNKLQSRYGLQSLSEPPAYSKSPPSTPSTFDSKSSGKLKLRARWVIGDSSKFSLFLDDLQYYNDKLENLFPPQRIGTVQRAWTNECLRGTGRDAQDLGVLREASKGVYGGLSELAGLKVLRVGLDFEEKNGAKKILTSSELRLRRDQIVFENQSDAVTSTVRSRATYHRPLQEMRGTKSSEEVPVFVEWTVFDTAIDFEQRCQVFQRIDNLARMLHSSSNKHPDLHTLDCIGYLDGSASSRYGMVYSMPHAAKERDTGSIVGSKITIDSLSSLVVSSPAPDLDIRFQLAHTLSISLWACHSLDWLHKTLRPDNILFFSSGSLTPDRRPSTPASTPVHSLENPYLAGFDSSRPDHIEEMSMAPRGVQGEELYRHPDSLGPHRKKYCKAFDIYSLGLLLLEIGMWKGLSVFHQGRGSKYSPSAFREKIIQGLVPALGSKTGSKYREVVRKCLVYEEPDASGEKGEKRLSSHQMMEMVVQQLESLVV